jgi:hypothetical protein
VPVRAYDLFVIWHHKTMKTPVPPDGDSGTRNAAHRGPVFLPWHRLMLRFMELNLQRVLEDPTFGLPYWDWTVDGSPAADGSPPAPASSLIWDRSSDGFRNRLEGFKGTGLHNQVHRWVNGDMAPAHSPNDPVFFLHHCNVDRIWEGWMRRHGRVYLPDMTESDTLKGHRIDDPMVSPLGKDGTPRSVLDQTAEVTYDSLP